MLSLYGSGNTYSDAKWDTLTGPKEWSNWERRLKNAARAERVHTLLTGELTKPIEPPIDCDTAT